MDAWGCCTLCPNPILHTTENKKIDKLTRKRKNEGDIKNKTKGRLLPKQQLTVLYAYKTEQKQT